MMFRSSYLPARLLFLNRTHDQLFASHLWLLGRDSGISARHLPSWFLWLFSVLYPAGTASNRPWFIQKYTAQNIRAVILKPDLSRYRHPAGTGVICRRWGAAAGGLCTGPWASVEGGGRPAPPSPLTWTLHKVTAGSRAPGAPQHQRSSSSPRPPKRRQWDGYLAGVRGAAITAFWHAFWHSQCTRHALRPLLIHIWINIIYYRIIFYSFLWTIRPLIVSWFNPIVYA